jgi:enamine deaminase RidA (YjgF/YER057c/UK114 family)
MYDAGEPNETFFRMLEKNVRMPVRVFGDMRAQLSAALDNVEAVLGAGGYALRDVVRLNYYVTDIGAFFAGFDAIRERLCASGAPPAGTLLGVTRLARPELMVEMEATAVR